ncbi:MAG: GNAT family N-acetyltransferase [Actinomycetota bacterium]
MDSTQEAVRGGPLIAQTQRLLLREQTLEDLDALASILCDAETMSYYPRPYTRAEARGWIERNLALYDEHGMGLWAMELKGSATFVGQCGLWPKEVEGAPEVEIGWHVQRPLWGRGFATEAARAARDLGFTRFGLDRMVSMIRPENAASRGVARNLGMTVEREFDHKGMVHLLYVIERSPSAPDPS